LLPMGFAKPRPLLSALVVSYTTVSPSPPPQRWHYASLLHFPSAYAAHLLDGIVALWRADFPQRARPAAIPWTTWTPRL